MGAAVPRLPAMTQNAVRPWRRSGQQRVESGFQLVGLDVFGGHVDLPVDAGERELLGAAHQSSSVFQASGKPSNDPRSRK